MHFFIYYIIYLVLNPQFYENIKQKNQHIEEFNQAIEWKDYRKAVNIFEKIDAVYRDIDANLRMNAAHAYFQLKDTLNARINYDQIKNLSDPVQSAYARNQLGVLALQRGDSATAISYFKEAIERNDQLKEAKFNFELISRLYNPPSNESLLPQPPANQDVEVSDEREDELNEYQPENISKDMALQLLENLRVSEKRGLISKKKSNQKMEKDW